MHEINIDSWDIKGLDNNKNPEFYRHILNNFIGKYGEKQKKSVRKKNKTSKRSLDIIKNRHK